MGPSGPGAPGLGLDDHAPRVVPGGGGVTDLVEIPHLRVGGLELGLGGRHESAAADGEPCEDFVAGQPQHVKHAVLLAPMQQLPAAKARLPAQDDAHLRPDLPQAVDQQLQNRAGVQTGVAVAGAQVGHPQTRTAEDVQRQEAVVVVVAVEEAGFLRAVNRVVGGIAVQNQLLRRLVEGGAELLHEHTRHPGQAGPAGAVLQAAERRGAGPPRRIARRRVAARPARRRGGPDVIRRGGRMVVEVLVAQRQGVEALGEPRRAGVRRS